MSQHRVNPPILIVGAHTMGLAVIRAFSGMNIERIVISYDKNDMGRVSRYVTRLLDSPHPQMEPNKFIEFLEELAIKYRGSMILPASDASLSTISKNKKVLDNYYIVGCPEWDIVESLIDKKKTYLLAERAGIPIPKTAQPKSDSDLEECLNGIGFPCLVKPCQSHLYFACFHTKMVLVNNREELIQAYHQAADLGLEVMIQEFIPGDDSNGVNYNSYFYDNQALVEFSARKIRNAPPQFGSPCVVYSKPIPQVHENGRKLLTALGFYGYSCMEFKLDERDGIYKLMEVNGRHNLSGRLAVKCGINFPVLHYRHLMFGEIPQQYSYVEDLYWIDLSRDVPYHLPAVFWGKKSLKSFLTPYFSKHVFAILDILDIRPFFVRSFNLVKDALRGKRQL